MTKKEYISKLEQEVRELSKIVNLKVGDSKTIIVFNHHQIYRFFEFHRNGGLSFFKKVYNYECKKTTCEDGVDKYFIDNECQFVKEFVNWIEDRYEKDGATGIRSDFCDDFKLAWKKSLRNPEMFFLTRTDD